MVKWQFMNHKCPVMSCDYDCFLSVQNSEGGRVPAGPEEPRAALPGLPEGQPGLPDVWCWGPDAGGVQLQPSQPALPDDGQLCRTRCASPWTQTASHSCFYHANMVWLGSVFKLTVGFTLQASSPPEQVRVSDGAVGAFDWLMIWTECAQPSS